MLSSKQRVRLSAIAQSKACLITLGRAGASEAFAARLDLLLDQHELVKLRFGDLKESRREIASELAARTGSELVRLIGGVALFWRRQADPEKRKVELED